MAVPSPYYKVLTYNTLIAYNEGQNWCEKNLPALKTVSWDERRSRLVEKMVETDPDVIALQEVVDREGQATFKQFADSLRERGYTGHFGRRPDGEGCAIFYKTCRFEHITSWTIDLDGGRIAFMSRIRSIEGDIFNVASLHLNHDPKVAGLQASQLARLVVTEAKEPTIIAGDFNLRRDTNEYLYLEPLFNVGFTDPHPAFAPATFRTTEETTIGRPGSDIGQFRIDYTLVSSSVTASDSIVCGDPDNLQTVNEPSDHLPAQVKVSFSYEDRKTLVSLLVEVRDKLRGEFCLSLDRWTKNIPELLRNEVYGEVFRLNKEKTGTEHPHPEFGRHAFLQESGMDVGTTIRINAIDAVLFRLAGQSPSSPVAAGGLH